MLNFCETFAVKTALWRQNSLCIHIRWKQLRDEVVDLEISAFLMYFAAVEVDLEKTKVDI